MYRIDLRDTDIDAARFFALAYRLFAYRGAMREEAAAEARNNETPQQTPRPVSAPHAQAQPVDGETWVSPDEMKTLFPDLFGM